MKRWGSWALCAVLVLVVLAEVARAPASTVVGTRYVDGFGTQWWYWYLGEVLAGRQSILHTDLLFFPGGKDIFAHTGGNMLDALCAWPLRLVLGPVLGYNAWIAVLVATNFAAGSHLGRVATGSPGWPAGLVLAANPFVLREIEEGRPTQAWLALPALALAGTWGARTVTGALATGVALAATGWLYWYYGLLFGVLAVVVGLVRLALGRDLVSLRVLAIAGAVTVAGVWPAFRIVVAAMDLGQVPGLLALDGTGPLAPLALRTVEGDPAGMQVLSVRGVLGGLVDEGGLRFVPGKPALGLAGVAAAAVGAVLAWRSGARGPVAAALTTVAVALAVAVGPVMLWPGGFVVNAPYLLALEHFDVLRRWWWPGRAVAGVVVALCFVAPVAARAPVGAAAVLLAVVVETWRVGFVPLSTWAAAPPRPLVCLADAPAGAVVDLPFLSDQRNLYFQTIHRHPILGGMLVKKPAFGSASALALRADNSLLDLVLDYGDMEFLREPVFEEADRQRLLDVGFRYVVADLSRFEGVPAGLGPGTMGGSAFNRVRRLLAPVIGAPVAEADGVAVWTLDGLPLPCPSLAEP